MQWRKVNQDLLPIEQGTYSEETGVVWNSDLEEQARQQAAADRERQQRESQDRSYERRGPSFADQAATAEPYKSPRRLGDIEGTTTPRMGSNPRSQPDAVYDNRGAVIPPGLASRPIFDQD